MSTFKVLCGVHAKELLPCEPKWKEDQFFCHYIRECFSDQEGLILDLTEEEQSLLMKHAILVWTLYLTCFDYIDDDGSSILSPDEVGPLVSRTVSDFFTRIVTDPKYEIYRNYQ